VMVPWLGHELAEIDELFGGDSFPYGMEPNRHTLETFVRYLAEQGYIPAPVPVDGLFAKV